MAVAWRDVAKVFPDGHQALAGVSLEARRGEVLAILGTSGSGKTTFLKLVNRLIDPTSGEVLVGDRPTTAWDPIELRRSMGYVIQEAGLMPHMTILANVGLVPKLKGVARAESRRVGRALPGSGRARSEGSRRAVSRTSSAAARGRGSAWPGPWRPTPT